MKRPSISDLMRETGLSRATVDRALNGRGGVHPRTMLAVEDALRRLRQVPGPGKDDALDRVEADLVLRVGRGFHRHLAGAAASLGLAGFRVHDLHQADDGAMLDEIVKLCRAVDRPLILTARNAEPLRAELVRARRRGKCVITFVSDLGQDSRDAFVGIDNRMAGQTAAFLVGNFFPHRRAKAGIVAGDYAYGCHEDREIGFRSCLRALFPDVEVADVAKGEDSSEQTYLATRRLLQAHPDLDAIYNVAGGHAGLAAALRESGRAGFIRVVAHEANAATLPLLHEGIIHCTLAQDARELLGIAARLAATGRLSGPRESRLVDFAVHTRFNLPSYAQLG